MKMEGFHFSYDPVPTDAMVKLRLDVISKPKLFALYLLAFSAFCLCFGLAFLSPDMFEEHQGAAYECQYVPNYTPDDCFPSSDSSAFLPLWIGRMQGVTPFSQFFIITADVYSGNGLVNSSTLSVSFELRLEMSLRAVVREGIYVDLIKSKAMSHTIRCYADNSKCETLFLGYEPYLDYNTYDIMIMFDNWSRVDTWVSEVNITVRSVTPAFSRYQLAVKYSFLALSLLSSLCYLYQILRLKVSHYTSETRNLALLSLSIVLFNDPLFLASLIKPDLGFTVVSVVSVVQFVVVLAYFWARVMLGIAPARREKWVKWGLGIGLLLLFAILTALYVYTSVQMKNDPSYRLSEFSPVFLSLAIAALALCGCYLLLLLVLTWRACPLLSLQSKRQRFLFYLNLGMAAFTIACIAAGFFQRLPSVGPFVLIVIAAYNIYVCLLQVLCVPSEIGILELNRELELTNSVSQAHKWEEEGSANRS
jgi:multisubunit Na+/H+ antiporter MnhB subunit